MTLSGTAGARRARRTAPADPDSVDAAYAAAVRRLAAQPQSRAMLTAKLVRAGYSVEAAEAAAARAAERGYLDDEEFARSLVRRRSQGRGQAMIARELRARGIEGGLAQAALGELDAGDELERARALAHGIVRVKPPAGWEQLRATVGARLGRRGFSSRVIARVLGELAGDLGRSGAPD
ncbi:MAG TPA: regulatory protein RecX [Candidatus Limnocylindrales bacterium]|nr:regulatory protein RecX [Candidatus Limnocylindrales bacterium]